MLEYKLNIGNTPFLAQMFDPGEIYPGKDHFLNYLAFHAGLFSLDQILTSQEVYGEVSAAVQPTNWLNNAEEQIDVT